MTSPRAATAEELAQCASEPIHIPGAIQPHGCLLAFDAASLRLRHVSRNAAAFLGDVPEALLGRAANEFLPAAVADALRRAARLDAAAEKLEASRDLGLFRWQQYLKFSTVGTTRYFDEGNGQPSRR